jgi:glycosyltransferase involved in cell wall biosynthesis
VPAHTCLLPRATLRELVAAAGLVISTDVPLVRTFSARRWAEGLAERLGPLSAPLDAVARRLPARAAITASLGDERVIVAHRVEVEHAPEPLVRDRGGPASVHVVLPAYRATRTIPDVVEEMPVGAADRTLLVDDASGDRTSEVALVHGLDVLRHPVNRGYGAGQKSGYAFALRDGADVIVMVHADNQYDPGLLGQMVQPILDGRADMVIGSRLLEDRAIAGGMPRWKWVGNRLLTGIENRAFGVSFSEYHTGYRAFSAPLLRSIAFLRNSDEFVFDQQIFAQVIARNARVSEIPIPTRYFREASTVDFATSLRYARQTLWVLARFRADRRGLAWTLLRRPAAWSRGVRGEATGA